MQGQYWKIRQNSPSKHTISRIIAGAARWQHSIQKRGLGGGADGVKLQPPRGPWKVDSGSARTQTSHAGGATLRGIAQQLSGGSVPLLGPTIFWASASSSS